MRLTGGPSAARPILKWLFSLLVVCILRAGSPAVQWWHSYLATTAWATQRPAHLQLILSSICIGPQIYQHIWEMKTSLYLHPQCPHPGTNEAALHMVVRSLLKSTKIVTSGFWPHFGHILAICLWHRSDHAKSSRPRWKLLPHKSPVPLCWLAVFIFFQLHTVKKISLLVFIPHSQKVIQQNCSISWRDFI